ncbi:TPA: peptidase S74, partial [Streptococcus pneumoniae]|nr:peptidase S74 [Streptococcus pneumoniae]
NTTTLELMDGMFKLNREYVTDLHFPAEVREVIQEICLKTGIELANDYFGISAMRYHIEQVPEGKKLSFRDMLSAMTQMIGMSCFFNREGKMEIRDLTESNITINADSYFLHGLTKSEIEYQIAGITCKTDKKSLTVGMKTGRSLELDNVFMTQSALNDLYYKLKNLTYYPYNLNYQGHLLLEVGQWVTIQTNKKETFKVPVLSQSFTFKGGLRGRISADSKAGNDTQYSYEGTITKQIKQQDGIEAKIQAQIEAADKDFDQKVDKIKKDFNDQVELAKARAEEVKRELSDTINQRFNSFDNGPLKETKRTAEEALRNAGASTLLAQEAKRIGLDSVARLEAFKSQTTSAQTALSGDLDALKRTIVNDIRPKQAQAEAEIAKQVEALSRTKNELAGASTLLAQEAKRIELDSVARLEAFKSQTTSAQTALSGDLDVLKQTIANDIRPKQAQAEAEIAKQVEALSRTKNELAGVKSAQATYEETTTRRLSELTNLAKDKASKSELTQTAEELASRIASVHLGRRNLLKGTKELARYKPVSEYNGFKVIRTVAGATRYQDSYVERTVIPTAGTEYIAIFYARASENDYPVRCHFYNPNTVVSSENSSGYKSRSSDGLSIIRLSTDWQLCWVKWTQTATDQAKTVIIGRHGPQVGGKEGVWVEICAPAIFEGNLAGDWSPAYEDQDERVSAVESNFKQRADSLEAGVNRLTEGLRTKADISSLNVTAENIRQSVKSLETDTQNKLNQKLSQAEFEVRAGSIRQEILNATKDKASKSELTQTAEELASRIASVQASGRNLFLNSLFKQDIPKTGIWTTSTYTATIDSESKYLGHNALKIIGLNPSGRDGGNPKVTYPALGQFGKVIPGSTTNQDVTISFYAKANKNGIMLRSRLGNIGYKTGNVTLSTEIKRYVVHIPKGWTNESKQTTNEWLFNFNQEGT